MPLFNNAPARTPRPDATVLGFVSLSGALFLALAFFAAWWSREWEVFSLFPPGASMADLAREQRQDLHTAFFTVWAALVVVAPALALLPWRRQSSEFAAWWLASWTVALMVFLVHFCWAVWVVFDGDWQRILHTPRVSAPVLDTVFAVWWCVDVGVAWFWRSEAQWVRVQRVLVHVLAFILFFMGAAREGELVMSHVLGWGLALAVLAGLLSRGWQAWRQARRATP